MSSTELTFSIVIPTYNRPAELEGCLQAIQKIDFPRDRFEVVVVDDGGSTPLDPVVETAGSGLQARLVVQSNTGPGDARNRGAEHARGYFLAFTDDDCRPDSAWLRSLEAVFSDHPSALLGGRTINYLDNPFSDTSQVIMEIVYDYYNSDPDNARFLASNNIAVGRAEYLAAGGFDHRFVSPASEDRELCDRWFHQGGRLIYVPGALVRHGHALSLRSFWRQHFNYGRGAYNYHQSRSLRGSGRLRDDLSFYSRMPSMLISPLSRRAPGRTFVIVHLLLVWQLANTAGYFYEKASRSKSEASAN